MSETILQESIVKLKKEIEELYKQYHLKYFTNEIYSLSFQKRLEVFLELFPDYAFKRMNALPDKERSNAQSVFLMSFLDFTTATEPYRLFHIKDGKYRPNMKILTIKEQIVPLLNLLADNMHSGSFKDVVFQPYRGMLRKDERHFFALRMEAFLYTQHEFSPFLMGPLYAEIVELLINLDFIRCIGIGDKGHEKYRNHPDETIRLLTPPPTMIMAVHQKLIDFTPACVAPPGDPNKIQSLIPDQNALGSTDIFSRPQAKSFCCKHFRFLPEEERVLVIDESTGKQENISLKKDKYDYILLKKLMESAGNRLTYQEVLSAVGSPASSSALSTRAGAYINNLRKKIFPNNKELATKVFRVEEGSLRLEE